MNINQIQLVLGAIITMSQHVQASPIHQIPNLTSITFYERTGGATPTPFTFALDREELTSRQSTLLGIRSNDFQGYAGASEFYDVYYSNSDGSFNLNGDYISVEASFFAMLPYGGGLNLAEIALNFSNNSNQYGDIVTSFVAIGDNAIPSSIGNAVDGNLQTHTTMGNNISNPLQRLRVTVGFQATSGLYPEPSPVPLPTAFWLFLSGIMYSLKNRM